MADPLGTTASVLAVLKLAVAATQYLKDVKQGSADRQRLRDELRSTTCLLEMIKDRIDDSESSMSTNSAEHGLQTLDSSSLASLAGKDGPVKLFQCVLEDIIAKLAPQDRLRRIAQPFAWPFEKKDIAELLAALERLKSHFTLVLQNNLVELSKISNLKLDGIRQQIDHSENRARDEEAEKTIQWISPVSYRAKHLDVLRACNLGQEVGFWNIQPSANGSTARLASSGVPGYREGQTPVALLSSLLQQLLLRGMTLPAEVLSLYQLHKKYSTRPTLSQVTETLRAITGRFGAFHVVVDALDECAESDYDALAFVSAVKSLGSCAKILCTSRFSTTFERYFDTTPRIEISAHSDDIQLFAASQIQQFPALARHVKADCSLEGEIVHAILGESSGMFLLAKLHLESLSKKINRKAVRAALQTLPVTLDATYYEAIQRIHNQTSDIAAVATSVLYWVLSTKRPLSVLELRHVYATRELPFQASLEDEDLPDEEILTATCGGLILVDGGSQTVRIVHYTAQQYFERLHPQDLAAASLSLARISLAYLTLPNFSEGVCKDDTAMSQRLEQYPFLDYASKNWGEHIGQVLNGDGDSEVAWPALENFVSNRIALDVATQAQSLPLVRYSNWSQEYARDVPAIALAAGFHVPNILRWLVTTIHGADATGSDRRTALMHAAAEGLADNVRVLLDLGADVNACDYTNETALQKAAKTGAEDVVQLLIGAGADVNAKGPGCLTSLMSAVSSGNPRVVEKLVQAGASLATETAWGDSALSIALRNGHEAITTLLADSGAILPQNPAGRRASVVASRRGALHLVRRLTAHYEALPRRPLQRQASRRMGGLQAIEEDAQCTDGFLGSDQPSDAAATSARLELEEEDFSEVLESLGCSVGFAARYNLGRHLETGAFAAVHTCVNKATGVVHAVKIWTVRKWAMSAAALLTLRDEIQFLREFQDHPHPGLLRMIELFADYPDNKVNLVTELAVGGDLFDLIVNNDKLSEQQSRVLFAQLFSALEFLHHRGWVHRDVKPENILIVDESNLRIKLGDFGLADKCPANSDLWHYGAALAGTPSYVAPEILQKQQQRKCCTPTDIWSAGVVLYICLCGFPPFSDELKSGEFPYELADQIRKGLYTYPSPYWDPVDDIALDLIDSMIVVDMEKRLTTKQCMAHPWMVNDGAAIL